MKNQQQKVGRGYGTRKASDTGIRDESLGTAGRGRCRGRRKGEKEGSRERDEGQEGGEMRRQRAGERGGTIASVEYKAKTKVRVALGNAQLPALWVLQGEEMIQLGWGHHRTSHCPLGALRHRTSTSSLNRYSSGLDGYSLDLDARIVTSRVPDRSCAGSSRLWCDPG